RKITSATSVDNLRRDAKRWLKALREAGHHVRSAPARPVLRDVQHALAREYGYESWIALKAAVEKPEPIRLVEDVLRAVNQPDEAALQRLNAHYDRTFNFDDLWAEVWRRTDS